MMLAEAGNQRLKWHPASVGAVQGHILPSRANGSNMELGLGISGKGSWHLTEREGCVGAMEGDRVMENQLQKRLVTLALPTLPFTDEKTEALKSFGSPPASEW